MAKKQTFAEKALKQHKQIPRTAEGDEILQVVKVRSFVNTDGHTRVVSKTVKITAKNQSEVFG